MSQLYTYLQAFSTGSAHSLLLANGKKKALETWRSLADKGMSTRAENVLQMRLRLLTPTRATKLAELETHIAAWDKERAYFQLLKPEENISDELEKACLIKMCPMDLAKHLQK